MQSFVSESRISRERRGIRPGCRVERSDRQATPGLNLPLDLREWVSPQTLLVWVGEELSALDMHETQTCTSESPISSPKGMLTILSFAYATGRFESEDIIHECRADPLFQSLGPGETAWPSDVAHFRRKNRGVLITVLARVIGRAFRQHFGVKAEVLPASLKQSFCEEAVERLDIARHMDIANVE